MANYIECYLDSKVCHPFNLQEFEIQVLFDNDSPNASVKTTNFEFWKDDAEAINAYKEAGLTGGKGIFEGLPLLIQKCGETLFEGSLDLSDEGTEFECDKVTTKAIESGKIDWVRDRAEGFSFAYLSDESYSGNGAISSSDYLEIPYVITEIPNYTQAMLMGISTFVIIREIFATTQTIAEAVASVLGGTTGILESAAILIALAIYLVAMIIAAVKMVQTLIDNIIQKEKFKLGMRVNTHFERACQFLGLNFSSSILQTSPYNELAIIPQKIVIPGTKAKEEKKSNSKYKGHFDGTFGDFIHAMEIVFNAKVRIIDQTLHFERVDYWNKVASYQLPNINISRSPYSINASELSSNLFVKYQLDATDLNTYDEYDGTSVQVITEPIVVGNRQKVMLKNLNYKNIPFALAKRKEELTEIETALDILINDVFGPLIEAVVNVGGGSYSVDGFENRIGWLKLSTDFIGVQKLALVGDDGYLASTNKEITGANYLYENFHKVSLPSENQYYIYKDKDIPLCCEDYVKIKNNNVIKTFSGEFAKVDSLTWNPHKETAKITYRVRKDYTHNLQTKIIVDGN